MDKASEAWRLDCEIRYIAGLSDDRRTEFYLAAKKHRGEAAATRLVGLVNQYRRAVFAATSTRTPLGSTAARTATGRA